MSDIPR